ncbi:hypothetical protein IP90_00502 [Luteimonas cucumeris]|uniref:Uncharacterized protein n=1 Tax=Luteimonas cucumeris TaxID=985012 RepID=A0A562LF52_9GAMM|nr:hypothetical protein IP90_00502 [Luteimonas cucumeris]
MSTANIAMAMSSPVKDGFLREGVVWEGLQPRLSLQMSGLKPLPHEPSPHPHPGGA